ncbi:MAG: hypothetical protein NUV75_10095, partial [Gallionella sp.]|nr:hypothetical protein [Gallionella sp.]
SKTFFHAWECDMMSRGKMSHPRIFSCFQPDTRKKFVPTGMARMPSLGIKLAMPVGRSSKLAASGSLSLASILWWNCRLFD